jgi:hypothetical protein
MPLATISVSHNPSISRRFALLGLPFRFPLWPGLKSLPAGIFLSFCPLPGCFCKVCCFEQTAKSACGTKNGVRVGLSSSAQGVVSVPPSHPPRPGQLPSCPLSLHTAISALTIAIRSRRTPSRRPAPLQHPPLLLSLRLTDDCQSTPRACVIIVVICVVVLFLIIFAVQSSSSPGLPDGKLTPMLMEARKS